MTIRFKTEYEVRLSTRTNFYDYTDLYHTGTNSLSNSIEFRILRNEIAAVIVESKIRIN